jgi:hypothetical protein
MHIQEFLFLQEKWSAIYSVHTILLSIQSLLGGQLFIIPSTQSRIDPRVSKEPNNDSPLNTEAAELWTDKKGTGIIFSHYMNCLQWIIRPWVGFVEQLKRYALW